MAFWDEMAEVVQELFVTDDDPFGEPIVIQRPAGGYDPATRKTSSASPLEQTVQGTLDSELTPVSEASSLAARYERVLIAAPLLTGGFEPGQRDRVLAENKTWQVMETAHVIKVGRPIMWICGLSST